MTRARFTLTIVTSRDGYIARAFDHAPQAWASPEEQVLFFSGVEAADWAIMGRNTHEAADRPDRRRIVFSSSRRGWIRPTQLWIDPEEHRPEDLAGLVSHVHPLRDGLILGGTRVHDWFHRHGAIDRIHLTIEPVDFGGGLPIFPGQTLRDPVAVFRQAGYRIVAERLLNEQGTRFLDLEPACGQTA